MCEHQSVRAAVHTLGCTHAVLTLYTRWAVHTLYSRCTHVGLYTRCTHAVHTLYSRCTHVGLYTRCTHAVHTLYTRCTHVGLICAQAPLHGYIVLDGCDSDLRHAAPLTSRGLTWLCIEGPWLCVCVYVCVCVCVCGHVRRWRPGRQPCTAQQRAQAAAGHARPSQSSHDPGHQGACVFAWTPMFVCAPCAHT